MASFAADGTNRNWGCRATIERLVEAPTSNVITQDLLPTASGGLGCLGNFYGDCRCILAALAMVVETLV